MYKVYLTPLNILKNPPPFPSILDLILNPGKISLNPKGEGGSQYHNLLLEITEQGCQRSLKDKMEKAQY